MLYFFVSILGSCFGSFLLCYCLRTHRTTHHHYRSHCPFCHHTLSWYEILPIVSYLLLKGRCKWCHTRLPRYYFITELVFSLLFIVLFFVPIHSLDAVHYRYVIILLLLSTLALDDALYCEVSIIHLGCFILIAYLINPFPTPHYLEAGIFFVLLTLIGIFKPHALGIADPCVISTLCLTLPLNYFSTLIFIASLLGLIFIAVMYFITQRLMRRIPFIPFISLSYWICLLLQMRTSHL